MKLKDLVAALSALLTTQALLMVTVSGQLSQVGKVRLINNEVFVEDPSGQLRQLTRDGEHKENVLLSPSGEKIIFHGKFNGYGPQDQPATTLTVLDSKTGRELRKVPFYRFFGANTGRFLESVQWVDDRYVILGGDRVISVLDLERGEQINDLLGSDFILSPDKRKIVFRVLLPPLYGPSQTDSDWIALTFIDRNYLPGEEPGSKLPAFIVLYPKFYSWGGIQKQFQVDEPDQHHELKSSLSWSPNSRSIAFVELHKGTYWTVVLDLEENSEGVRVTNMRRFRLGTEELALREVKDIAWMDEKTLLVIGTKGVFDKVRQAGLKQVWQIDLESGAVWVVEK
jgi:hypothetical protein